nr:hypothetical protein [uncultured Flavobacterium sp.]
MIKKIVFSLSMLCTVAASAQENTGSPYSFYGLGDQKFKGANEHRAMGGLSVVGDSIHLNLSNPASYSDLALTTFSIGASHTAYNFKTDLVSENASKTSLDYLAVAFPAGKKMGISFGLMPYTSVGYQVVSSNMFGDEQQSTQSKGKGGLNKVYLGASYKVTKKLSFGFDAQYYFGKIENRTLLATQGVQYISRSINETNNSGLAFNFGTMYQTKIKNLDVHSALTFSPQANLNSTHERKIGTIVLGTAGSEITIEDRNIDVADSKFKMPMTYSFGTSIGKLNKWMIGAQATLADAQETYESLNITDLKYNSSSKLTLGGYYVPKYNSFNSYFSRVTYRAGLRYENTGMEIKGEKIDDMAVTAGLGLPLGYNFSNLNIGFEYGKRGTSNAGLVKENYFMVTLGISFNDRWFQKVKFY